MKNAWVGGKSRKVAAMRTELKSGRFEDEVGRRWEMSCTVGGGIGSLSERGRWR